MNWKMALAFAGLLFGFTAFAAEVPGGINQTADGLPNDTYQIGLSPSYTLQPSGAYLSSDLRYQPNEDFGAGLGFGAGEVGFNLGANGTWYILPDSSNAPALAVQGGVYFNRLVQNNYFDLKITPLVSKDVPTNFGRITPYAGLSFTPSFRLNNPSNEFSMQASVGAQFAANQFEGLSVFTEFDLGLVNSVHTIAIGISYPFMGLGG